MSYKFFEPLIEGVIISRDGRFLMQVDIEGLRCFCHCPTTGRIGNIELAGRPCLLSESSSNIRKTRYTIEAISFDRQSDINKSWIGINQNAVNRYVEYYLKNGGFCKMIPTQFPVVRERLLGRSRLDFLVGNIYLEVKSPLQDIQLSVPEYIATKKMAPSKSVDRLIRHVSVLKSSLQRNQRAIMLLAFVYDNPGFKVITHSKFYERVRAITNESFSNGVELWQANFRLTKEKVTLDKYFQIFWDTIV